MRESARNIAAGAPLARSAGAGVLREREREAGGGRLGAGPNKAAADHPPRLVPPLTSPASTLGTYKTPIRLVFATDPPSSSDPPPLPRPHQLLGPRSSPWPRSKPSSRLPPLSTPSSRTVRPSRARASLSPADPPLLLLADYARAVESRQRLDAQKTENEGVKKVRSRSRSRHSSLPRADPPPPPPPSLAGARQPHRAQLGLQARRPHPHEAGPV